MYEVTFTSSKKELFSFRYLSFLQFTSLKSNLCWCRDLSTWSTFYLVSINLDLYCSLVIADNESSFHLLRLAKILQDIFKYFSLFETLRGEKGPYENFPIIKGAGAGDQQWFSGKGVSSFCNSLVTENSLGMDRVQHLQFPSTDWGIF